MPTFLPLKTTHVVWPFAVGLQGPMGGLCKFSLVVCAKISSSGLSPSESLIGDMVKDSRNSKSLELEAWEVTGDV